MSTAIVHSGGGHSCLQIHPHTTVPPQSSWNVHCFNPQRAKSCIAALEKKKKIIIKKKHDPILGFKIIIDDCETE